MSNKIISLKDYARSQEVVGRFVELVGSMSAANAYITGVLMQVAERPELRNCTPQSIIGAALRAATMRLWTDPALGQAYIVPYKDKATLVVGYKGLIAMAQRTNKYRHINATSIDDGEEVIEDKLRGLHQVKRIKPGTRTVGYLAYFAMTNGFERSLYMTREEVQEHAKKYSKSYNRSDSPWQTEFDKMAQKTVLRQLLLRFGQLDPIMRDALAGEDEAVIDGEFELPDANDMTLPEQEEEKPPRSAEQAIEELFGKEQ